MGEVRTLIDKITIWCEVTLYEKFKYLPLKLRKMLAKFRADIIRGRKRKTVDHNSADILAAVNG